MQRRLWTKRTSGAFGILLALGVAGVWPGTAVALMSSGAPRVAAMHVGTPTAPAKPAVQRFTVLRAGAQGARVKLVQHALRKRGYKVMLNGKFGPQTRAAVRKFQRTRHIRITGIVDSATWKALGLGLGLGPGGPGGGTTTTTTLKPTTTTRPTTTTTTTIPADGYKHPNPNVERWHSVAVGVGWAEQNWKHLSCVIQRESKGNPKAQNPSTAMGLLQIVYRAHKAWIGPDASILLDGSTNLRLGLKMFKSSGWHPWSGSIVLCG
jgi:hypothetical protein